MHPMLAFIHYDERNCPVNDNMMPTVTEQTQNVKPMNVSQHLTRR